MGRRAGGYTLLEVMIVLAILAFILTIAMPAFIKARERARLSTCQENQIKVDEAVQRYIIDNNYADQAAAVQSLSAISELVGDDMYLRWLPACPSGGTYTLQETGPSVACDASTPNGEGHPFPNVSGGT